MRTPRRAAAAAAVLSLTLSVFTMLAPPASAEGNNGTIKVDEQGVENGPGAPNSNDPHIACAGRIEFYGFDDEEVTSQVTFEVQAPTSNTGSEGAATTKSYTHTFEGDGPGGNDLDSSMDFDLSDLLANYEPHPKQGYHVKVTTNTEFSNGNDVKHKVFWVAPCESEQTEFGGLTIDKDLAGTDAESQSATEFEFTIACSLNGTEIDLAPEDDSTNEAVVLLTGGEAPEAFDAVPTGAICTVTETGDGDAESTDWFVGGEDADEQSHQNGDEYVTVNIPGNADVAVRAVNTFNTVVTNPTGGLTVDKALDGNNLPPATTAFAFTVDCGAFDLNGPDTEGTDAIFTLTAADDPEPFSGIPTGTSCTITETDDADADSTRWTVDTGTPTVGSSVTVEIGNATTLAVLATNVFNETVVVIPPTGSLSIDKLLDGDDQPVPGTQFTFVVECVNGATAVDLNGADAGTALTVTVTAAQAARVISGIPTGAVCSITETDDGDATETSWMVNGLETVEDDTSVDDLTIGNGTTVAVVATNIFDSEVGGVVTPRPPVVAPPVFTPPVFTPPVKVPTVAPQKQLRPDTVLGARQSRQLPRTGGDALPLTEAGLGLLLLGAGFTLSARRSATA